MSTVPDLILERRYRRQAIKEADDYDLQGQERDDYIEARVAELRRAPFSSVLPVTASRSRATSSPRVVRDYLAGPRFEVRLSYGVRKRIVDEIRAESPRGFETGGFLFAHHPADRGSGFLV